MTVVSCRNLRKEFGRLTAIDNLSFEIEENTITGLIGRNGAGKTTLLKLIAGYLRPSGGEIRVFSRNPFNNLTVAANMIYIDDRMEFPPSMPLKEILKFAADFYPNWDGELAGKLLAYFELDPLQTHPRLSKGMRSTFHGIIGLASRCPLTILDEPTTGMDIAKRKDFYRALLRDYVDHPRTIILSSHQINEVDNMLEHVLLIDRGSKRLHLPLTECKEYALGLRGDMQTLHKFAGDMEIIYREAFALNNLYLVVRNNLSESLREEIRRAGITISAVQTEDLCVYLTNSREGGIDDVFAS